MMQKYWILHFVQNDGGEESNAALVAFSLLDVL
jgi:hypothetical protein